MLNPALRCICHMQILFKKYFSPISSPFFLESKAPSESNVISQMAEVVCFEHMANSKEKNKERKKEQRCMRAMFDQVVCIFVLLSIFKRSELVLMFEFKNVTSVKEIRRKNILRKLIQLIAKMDLKLRPKRIFPFFMKL